MRLPAVIGDNMVVPRGRPIPIWGWTVPHASVKIRLGSNSVTTSADSKGAFKTSIPPMPAGGPHELVVEGPSQAIRKNILVGEVWVCSGQSNMQWPVQSSADPEKEIAAASFPEIRFFTVPNDAVLEPQTDVAAEWLACTPGSVADFSAVGYYFGRELHRLLGVPIGLINSSWGATRIEAWISRGSLMSDPVSRKEIEQYEDYLATPKAAENLAAFLKLPSDLNERERLSAIPDPGNQGFAKGWADPAFDDSEWPTMTIPQGWQQAGHNVSGVFWFRKRVDLPADWAGMDLTLRLGACDKHDTTYFNNEPIGATGWETESAWCSRRGYTVPGRLVRAGTNEIAVRVYSYIYQGGMIGPASSMRIGPAVDSGAAPKPLDGTWRYQMEHDFGFVQSPPSPPGAGNPNSPHILYDSMIYPLLPYAVRGVIWYQGEGNCDRAFHYRTLQRLLICDWRKAWGSEDLHFLIVQLANYMPIQKEPCESVWAELREAQRMALSLPNTGMAVAIDIGDAVDIHPINKQEVGRRLARSALAGAYGQQVVFSGPMLLDSRIEGNAIRLRFDPCGAGLASADGGPLKGFAVAGDDCVFHWAHAQIEEDTLLVHAETVPNPVSVRYAWADNPVCNLINGDGLPASPFRTDDEPGLTAYSAG